MDILHVHVMEIYLMLLLISREFMFSIRRIGFFITFTQYAIKFYHFCLLFITYVSIGLNSLFGIVMAIGSTLMICY